MRSGQITRQLKLEDELHRKREELVAIRAALAERESELVDFRDHFGGIGGFRRSYDPVNPAYTIILCCGFLSLMFVAFVATELNAQVTAPDLTELSPAEREMAQSACNGDRVLNGPAAYYRCLNGQLQELRGNSGMPDLSGLSPAAREMAESACNFNEPAAYYRCLNRQLQELRSSSGMPDLSSLSSAAREMAESACNDDRVLNGPAAYYRCLADQLRSLNASGGQITSPPRDRSFGKTSTPSAPEAPPTPNTPPSRTGPDDSGWRLTVVYLLIAGIIITLYILYAKGRRRKKEAAHRARRAEEQRERAKFRHRQEEETKRRGGVNANQGDGKQIDPFAVLGLRPGASKEEIRGAYLNLIAKYHPDKVAHLGIEFQEPAKAKTLQLIRAYEMLHDK